MRPLELSRMRFGRLTVLSRSDNIKGKTAWLCKCDCGNKIVVSANNLTKNNTLSCGCYRSEQVRKACRIHGDSGTSMYYRWQGIKARCLNPKSNVYKYYGARGISICDEWKNDFNAFLTYVSKLPHYGEKGRSIDRINNNGNYEPGNVRWATQSEQVKNSRRSKNATESK